MSIRRSLAYSAADSYLSLVLQVISTMVISRILTPEQAGVFAVATVFAALAMNFRDFGIAEYLIQAKELTEEKIRAAFTLNIAVSWAMGALLLACSGLAASFYRNEGVAQVMRLQAINFVIVPFGALTMAYFRRQLNFKPLFVASMVSSVGSFVVAITCAVNGLGYMSLAWASLTGVVLTVAVSLLYRPKEMPFLPGLRGLREAFHFGKFASGTYFLAQVGKGAPEMIIGRAQSMASVAFFSRAIGVVDIFNRLVLRAVLPVCMPYFAQSSRDGSGLVKGYLICVSYLTAIGWPFIAFLGVIAFSAVRLIYGPQWLEAVPLTRIVCIAACVELVHRLAREALLSQGKAKSSANLQIGIMIAQVIGLFAVVPFGLEGAAWGFLAGAIVGTALSQRVLHLAIGLQLRDVFAACMPSLWLTLIAVTPISIWALLGGIRADNYLLVVLAGGMVTGASWLLGLKLLRHPLWDELMRILASLRKAVTRS